jgi:hypothetical protein
VCKIGLNSWLKFKLGGNWLYIIFLWIVLEAANLVVMDRLFLQTTGYLRFGGNWTTLFSCELFWMEVANLVVTDRLFLWTEGYLRFGGNWLYIIFGWNVLEAANWVVKASL